MHLRCGVEASDESAVDGQNNQCMSAGIHQAGVDTTIEGGKASLRYFGHVVREERGMENDVMLGEMSGKRRYGRPSTRWLDNTTP